MVSGFYDVRMRADAWELGGEVQPSKIVYVDVNRARFDAEVFGGSIVEPLWEWRGPIKAPDTIPGWLPA